MICCQYMPSTEKHGRTSEPVPPCLVTEGIQLQTSFPPQALFLGGEIFDENGSDSETTDRRLTPGICKWQSFRIPPWKLFAEHLVNE